MKLKLTKILLALVISAALAAISLFAAIYLGQAALEWFELFSPRTQALLRSGLIILISLVVVYAGWRYRKAVKAQPKE